MDDGASGTTAWVRVDAPSGPSPSARSGASAVVLGNHVYLLGGLAAGGEVSSEMWAADLQPRDLSWSRVDVNAMNTPAARYRHSATPISKTRMLVFGGLHSGSQRLNDTWIFDAAARSWSQVFVAGLSSTQGGDGRGGANAKNPRGHPRGLGKHAGSIAVGGAGSAHAHPLGRAGARPLLGGGGGGGLRSSSMMMAHSGAAGGRSRVSFGGGGLGGGDMSFVAAALAGSSEGGSAATAHAGGSSFGGTSTSGGTGGGDDSLADVGQHVEEGTAHISIQQGDDVPAPRCGHSAVCLGDSVWLFGGYGGSGFARRDFGDVHRFHIPSQSWSAVKTQGDAAAVAVAAAAAASSGGGDGGAGQPPPPAPTHPAPRSGHSAVAVGSSLMVIHGGWSVSGAFHDTWALDTAALTWRRLVTTSAAAAATPDGAAQAAAPAAGGWRNATDGAPTRWGHVAVAVCAVPHWQVFCFGGSTNTPPLRAAAAAATLPRATASSAATGTATSRMSTLGLGEPAKPAAAAATAATTSFLGETLVLDMGSHTCTEIVKCAAPAAAAAAAATLPPVAAAAAHLAGGVSGGKAAAAASAAAGGVTTSTTGSGRLVTAPASPVAPPAAATRPLARADSTMVYDPFNKRLLLMGGWANRWLGDAWALPVGGLVGPPYAVLGLEPPLGPVTGGQPLLLRGKGFDAPGSAAAVRFTLGKRTLEAQGVCRSDSELEVATPAFESPGLFDVRVSLRGQPWSITSRPYSVFHVTSSLTSLAFGPGLLDGCAAGARVSFVIQARDTAGSLRAAGGGDEFSVAITQQPGAAPVEAVVADDGTGRYVVSYVPPAAGAYAVAVAFKGTFGGHAGPIRGSPYAVRAVAAPHPPATTAAPPPPHKDVNSFSGPLVWDTVKALIEAATATAKSTLEGISKDVAAEAAASAAAAAGAHTAAGGAQHSRAADASSSAVAPAPCDMPSLDLVLSVKAHLSSVSSREDEMRLRLDAGQGLLDQLRREGVRSERELGALEGRLAKAAATWDAASRAAPAVKAALAPYVKHWSQQTRKDVESFEAATASFVGEAHGCAFWEHASGPDGAGAALAAHGDRFASFARRVERLQHVTGTLDLPNALAEVHRQVKEVADDTADVARVWAVARDAAAYLASAHECLWSAFVPDELEEGIKGLQKRLKAPCTKRVRGSNAFKGVDKTIRDFMATLPLMAALRHKSMRPRHWSALLGRVAGAAAGAGGSGSGGSGSPSVAPVAPHEDPALRLGALLELRLHEHSADVEETCDQAAKEAKMEESLRRLEVAWGAVQWRGEPVKEGSDVMLLRVAEDDWEMCEGDQLTVQGMMTSRYLAFFEAEVLAWRTSLAAVSEVVTQLTEIQRKWSYLAALFIASDEVRRELPEDAARFEGIDVQVTAILRAAWAARKVKDACNVAGLLPQLEALQAGLDACEKALSDFIARKQSQFPRFYFVSRADLLDILSNGSNPARIVHHVPKVLLATDSLALADSPEPGGRPLATSFTSCVGVETVQFVPPVRLDGKVEVYMQTVLDAQRDTLRRALDASIARRATQSRVEWICDKLPGGGGGATDPAQITLLVSGMDYVTAVDDAFDGLAAGHAQAMRECLDAAVGDLNDLIRLTQSSLSRADRARVMCLITLDAHGRDIIQKLILEGVADKSAFQWQSQLKQRYLGSGRAQLAIADARFDYQFEYLGNGPRLVITPLTDRIYVTATQALNLKMGCAPAGPAGTGKTESTKDLSSAMAIPCYVINCAPEMDYKSLAGIFKGLAASGSWGCFDEFNRLVPEVLSVCATQFGAVLDSIRSQRSEVVIEGDCVRCVPTAGAFITMNPGYLGRSELPEGLKSLFRPITVMIPDLVLICENMLMAEGFVEAKVLASKFYSLYSLCKELLSKQAHYDWGLRAIKSVLVVAGSFKRAEPHLPEDVLLMRALRDFNTPKLPTVDEGPFFGLLGDLFPGVSPPRKQDATLEEAVVAACALRGLDPDEQFRLKCVQLEELLAIRHCVFVIGPPASGKTTCWQTLVAARGVQGRKTKVVDLDPKVQSPEELYGYVHPATREWRDGLLSRVMRDLASEPGSDAKWILLDGDLDANWIESMNSVMDDNKLLTLASNERIPLKPHMRMVFEIRDLRFASPATVSRAGIIYISTQTGSQWRSLIATWLAQLQLTSAASDGASEEEGGGGGGSSDGSALVKAASQSAATPPPDGGGGVVRATLRALFDQYCAPAMLFLKKECKSIVPVEDATLVTNLLRLLDACLPRALLQRLGDAAVTPPDEAARVLEMHFVFCGVWAFGAALTVVDSEDYRLAFSNWWRGEFKSIKLPSRETVFDYWLNPASLQFDSWKACPFFSELAFDSRRTAMAAVTVPTPESCAITYWTDQLLRLRKPVMLAGYAGCGKTQLVCGLLASQPPETRLSTVINFNYYTGSKELQATLEAPLEKKTGSNYGPKGKAAMVFFLDDLNLPEVDRYDTQSAIALVRQHLDYGHWYDRTKLTSKTVNDCQYVAAMNPSAGSFQVNPRLQRHFFTLAVGFPGPASLHTIFSTFLEGHLRFQSFGDEVQACAQNLLSAALTLHASVAATFRKSATCFHYEYTVRHLASVFSGLLQAGAGEFKDPNKLATLWLHESERVYGDRLVSTDDLARYRGLAAGIAKKKFPAANLGAFFLGERPDPLLFSHFSPETAASGARAYDRVPTLDKLRSVVEEALREYNESNAEMSLVLFDDALAHVARIARVLMSPQGHALLVGVGGSGKQSLARLAASMCGFRVVTITIASGYGLGDFMADVQAMYRLAGLKDEGVVFLFTDSQITNERFLVVLNDMLASGNVPGLFPPEDEDAIVTAMGPKVKAATGCANPTRDACWAHFLAAVKRNLHVVLCFSPVGDDFRSRAKRFPALSSATTIDWFHAWPREALHSVAVQFMRDVDLASVGLSAPEGVRDAIVRFMPFAFDSVNRAAHRFGASDRRHVYTTPKSFLESLKLYKALLRRKHEENEAARTRLSSGLAKLRETSHAVAHIEEELKVSLLAAEEKRGVAEGIAADVSANKTVVEGETGKANVMAEDCAGIAARATAIREDAERDLAEAIPAVEKAMAALACLDKKELAEAKTMAKTPPGVDDVFGAVMVLLAGVRKEVKVEKNGKVKDRSWDASKKCLLGDIKVLLEQLLAFKEAVDGGEVPDVNFKEVRPFLEMEHFTPETIRAKNSAAAGLCSWVINIVAYYDIVVQVEPKKQRLREANAELEGANARLSVVREQVAQLQAQLDELNVKLRAAEAEKAAAVSDVARGRAKLELATRLTAALADENVRWAQAIDEMEASKESVVGDSLLAAAFISYIGPFTKRYRDELVHKAWVPFLEASQPRIPMSASASPLGVLTDEATIAGWNSEGLPDDTVSTENGAICCCTERWPLLIDPQLQGISWLRERFKDAGLLVLRMDQKDMLRRLEQAIERGAPVVLENLPERLDAILQPVISRSLVKRGARQYLKLGDKEVEWNPAFRLFLHTKLSNPHYAPEVQAETALVNFTVTEAGLEEQLLALTVGRERPDLSTQKTALIKQSNAFKVQIKALEDGILAKLASAQGDITEDRELIEGLENTKRIALDIADKSIVVAHTTAEINRTAEKYRSVAHRAALLFFLMQDLGRIHTYYSYSLAAFVTVFDRAIDSVSSAPAPAAPAGLLLADDAGEAADEAAGAARDATSRDEPPPEHDEAAGTPQASPESGAAVGSSAATASAPISPPTPAAGAATAALVASQPAPLRRAGSSLSPPPPPPPVVVRALSDGELVTRCATLRDATTAVTFKFVNRGLFEKDRLTVAVHLCLKLAVDAGDVSEGLVRTLVVGPALVGDAGRVPAALADWLPESVWLRVRALESVRPAFERLSEDMCGASSAWQAWFDAEKPEVAPPPGEYASLGSASPLCSLLLLRVLRPDRLNAGLRAYVAAKMGELYVQGEPFSMPAAFAESSPTVPIFFVLFPGVDPTVWVEALGHTMGITQGNGRLVNISMGQGQEARAGECLKQMAASGGWVLLQNVHLMSAWLPLLERQLEVLAEGAHPQFRCFISAEPPPLASMANMPESLLQGAIKVANEAPADLLSNLSRSWGSFSEERVAACNKPAVFKATLFALCFYHAIVLGRRRFGTQGWSRKYSFNAGDLTVCANVLCEYINSNASVPWQDLRYIFGEIMYGGHITDAWDRRTNNTYLAELLRPEVCTERSRELAPGFFVPDAAALDFAGIARYIVEKLPRESPAIFGLHNNAEIGYLTSTGDELLRTILAMSPLMVAAAAGAPAPAAGSAPAAAAAATAAASAGTAPASAPGGGGGGARVLLEGLLERLPPEFVMLDLEARAAPLLRGPTAPFVLVCLQECESMNALLAELRRSLVELRKGLDGALNMSEPMEDLAAALLINQVPGRNPLHKCSWERLAWPSRRGLASWFADLLRRVEQLGRWSAGLFVTPACVWLPGLFNPMAFLTAVVQRTCRATGLPLDKATITVHVTSMARPEQVTGYPPNGMFVSGLFMEGAGWPTAADAAPAGAEAPLPSPLRGDATRSVNGVGVAGAVTDAKLKLLLQPMPVLYLEAVPVQPTWLPSSVGYLRQDPAVYECPLFATTLRGGTYVCLATLATRGGQVNRWVLAGAALVMQEDD